MTDLEPLDHPFPSALTDQDTSTGPDPVFTIVSSDGRTWFDPYSGRPRAIDGNLAATIDKHRHPSGRTLPLTELRIIRWQHDLPALVRNDARFRMFNRHDGAWIDPFLAVAHRHVTTENGRISRRTVTGMAAVLGHMNEAEMRNILDQKDINARLKGQRPTRVETSKVVTGKVVAARQNTRQASEDNDHRLDACADIQRRLLPSAGPRGALQWKAHIATTQPLSPVFYDLIVGNDDRLVAALIQIEGKGPERAFAATALHAALRALATSTAKIDELASRLNDLAVDCLLPGQCAVATLLQIETSARRLSCLQAGGPQALLLNPASEVMARRFGTGGMAMGLRRGETFTQSTQAFERDLSPGDLLVLTTATGRDDKARRRLAPLLLQYADADLDEVCHQLDHFDRGVESGDRGLLLLRLSDQPSVA